MRDSGDDRGICRNFGNRRREAEIRCGIPELPAAYDAVKLGNRRREPGIRCGIPELTAAYAALKLGDRRREPEIRCDIPDSDRGICRG